jgi:hypothetical protein
MGDFGAEKKKFTSSWLHSVSVLSQGSWLNVTSFPRSALWPRILRTATSFLLTAVMVVCFLGVGMNYQPELLVVFFLRVRAVCFGPLSSLPLLENRSDSLSTFLQFMSCAQHWTSIITHPVTKLTVIPVAGAIMHMRRAKR